MNAQTAPGYLVFSLDTELAWGELWGHPVRRAVPRNGALERDAICRILDLMDEFGVAATWAFTGHLFYDHCEECAICPIEHLKGRDPRYAEIWGTHNSLWYGADIVEAVASRPIGHEIAFHGYTHRYFSSLTDEEARFEISEWIRLAARRGIAPRSVIFPQGRIGHLDLFREAGFVCYRGWDVKHPVLAVPLLGKVVNRINLKLSMLAPQPFDPILDASGLVNIPSSQWIFRTDRRLEQALDALGLPYLRFSQTARAIHRAAHTGRVIHLWAHPHEFRKAEDFDKLRFLFSAFAEESQRGRLDSITMGNLAARFLADPVLAGAG